MNFVAIEFDNGVNNTHALGYLKVPDNFHYLWAMGFRDYIRETYKATDVRIYPLRVRHGNEETDGDPNLVGYTNMEDDFIKALRSNYYYPVCASTNSIRRQWSMLDPMTPDYTPKER